MNSFYQHFIGQFVQRWLTGIASTLPSLSVEQHKTAREQAVIGWLQTVLLSIAFLQIIFAGLLRALPPDVRAALGFLHRIEWAAYAGIMLIVLQVASGWSQRLVVTNRFGLLAWFLSQPRLVIGSNAHRLQLAYLALAILMIAAVIWVRINGFIVTSKP